MYAYYRYNETMLCTNMSYTNKITLVIFDQSIKLYFEDIKINQLNKKYCMGPVTGFCREKEPIGHVCVLRKLF